MLHPQLATALKAMFGRLRLYERRSHALAILALGCLAVIALYLYDPQLDLEVSGLFYEEGSGFVYREHWFSTFFRDIIPIVCYLLGAVVLLLGLARLWSKRLPQGLVERLPDWRVLLYIVVVFALAPGLAVNGVLKEGWGRERPKAVVQFGGTKTFSPPFVISPQSGKSFPSGHASAAFAFLTLALRVRRPWRRWAYLAGWLFGIATALSRVTMGAHYLSDVLIGSWVSLVMVHLWYGLLFGEEEVAEAVDLQPGSFRGD